MQECNSPNKSDDAGTVVVRMPATVKEEQKEEEKRKEKEEERKKLMSPTSASSWFKDDFFLSHAKADCFQLQSSPFPPKCHLLLDVDAKEKDHSLTSGVYIFQTPTILKDPSAAHGCCIFYMQSLKEAIFFALLFVAGVVLQIFLSDVPDSVGLIVGRTLIECGAIPFAQSAWGLIRTKLFVVQNLLKISLSLLLIAAGTPLVLVYQTATNDMQSMIGVTMVKAASVAIITRLFFLRR